MSPRLPLEVAGTGKQHQSALRCIRSALDSARTLLCRSGGSEELLPDPGNPVSSRPLLCQPKRHPRQLGYRAKIWGEAAMYVGVQSAVA